MAEYRLARLEEEEDVLDFVNMVFSQASIPRHFDTLIPKVYAHPGYSDYHYVAVEQGRIRGCVAMLPMTLHLDGEIALKGGYIGSVSVHERTRGAGHMKALMNMAIEEAKEKGYDLIGLGGQRQRYNYWGFERCGQHLSFQLTGTNIRHRMQDVDGSGVKVREIKSGDDPALEEIYALACGQDMVCQRPRERFWEIMRSYENALYALEDGESGALLGYICGGEKAIVEMALKQEEKIPQALKAWMADKTGCVITVGYDQKALAAFLKKTAEHYTLQDAQMFRILNWQRVLEAALSYKQKKEALMAGRAVVEIEGEGRYAISVQRGQVTVTPTQDQPERTLSPREAVSFFFSPYSLLTISSPLLKNWLPLPLGVKTPDKF